MNCAHCGVEIRNESILNKSYNWRFSKNGKYLCKNCGYEVDTLFDLPIFIILLFISLFLLGGGLEYRPLAILGIVYVFLVILYGFRSTAFSQIKKWFEKVDEFYEGKKIMVPDKILIKKEDENTIMFEDKDESGVIKATIGFQIVEGQLTIYMKGYKIDSIKFPKLEGFYGYSLTDEELDTFKDFLQKMDKIVKELQESSPCSAFNIMTMQAPIEKLQSPTGDTHSLIYIVGYVHVHEGYAIHGVYLSMQSAKEDARQYPKSHYVKRFGYSVAYAQIDIWDLDANKLLKTLQYEDGVYTTVSIEASLADPVEEKK